MVHVTFYLLAIRQNQRFVK